MTPPKSLRKSRPIPKQVSQNEDTRGARGLEIRTSARAAGLVDLLVIVEQHAREDPRALTKAKRLRDR